MSYYWKKQVEGSLDWIRASLTTLNERMRELMATVEEMRATIADIDVETTRVADEIAELVARIEAGGMSAAEEAQVKADLDAQLAKLRAVGHTPVP